jgi:hypothetical protein
LTIATRDSNDKPSKEVKVKFLWAIIKVVDTTLLSLDPDKWLFRDSNRVNTESKTKSSETSRVGKIDKIDPTTATPDAGSSFSYER